jgi:hypothetical protein
VNRKPTTCRACGAAIFFGITEKGNRMPIDVEPHEQGTICVEGPGEEPSVRVIQHGSGKAYRSHFETCTDPKRFRKADRQRRLL